MLYYIILYIILLYILYIIYYTYTIISYTILFSSSDLSSLPSYVLFPSIPFLPLYSSFPVISINLPSSSIPFSCSQSISLFPSSLLPSQYSSPPNPLIHSIRVGSSIYLFIFSSDLSNIPNQTIRPRMFYRSGWLRCDVSISIGFGFMF